MKGLKEAPGFSALSEEYLFAETTKRIREAEASLGRRVARLGMGDVSHPLTPTVCRALTEAAREMGIDATRRGYSPIGGYGFLRAAAREAYAAEGVDLGEEEIYISDGAKGELSLIASLLAPDTLHLILHGWKDSSGKKAIRMRFSGNQGCSHPTAILIRCSHAA